MIKIKADIKSALIEFENVKKAMNEGLADVIRNYISNFVTLLANQNPVGDDVTYRNWYLFRQRWYAENRGLNLQPKAGLSKSNWRVSLSPNASALIQDYSANESKIEADAYSKLSNYTLGKTVYIINTTPYIYKDGVDKLGVGRSKEKIDVSTAYQIAYSQFVDDVNKLQMTLNKR